MKPVKAIDLVWEAQPMISTLRTIMQNLPSDRPGKGSARTLAENCGNWLDKARELLNRKESKK